MKQVVTAISIGVLTLAVGAYAAVDWAQDYKSATARAAKEKKLLMVDLYADWCGPCQQAQPTLRWLEQQGIKVVHVNVDQQPEMCRQYGVTSYPTFFVYVCGHDTVRTQNINEVVNCMYWLKDKHHAESPSQELP